jgi:hypothetical protein
MRKSKLDKPIVKAEVVQRLATGEAQAEIARDVGLHRSGLCRFAKREDVKALIEHEQMRLAEVIPDAVDNVKALIREMPNISPNETKRRELSYKASTDVLKAAGILPVPVQSQTLIWNSKTTIVSPLIQKLLESIASNLTLPDDEIVSFDEQAK